MAVRRSFAQTSRDSLHAINRTEQGLPWLADKHISDWTEEILSQPTKSLVEATRRC